MPNQTELCNLALAEISENSITDISEENERARLCSLHLDPTIGEVLRSGKFRCARKRAVLAQDSVAPGFGYTYSYQLPSDFLRVVSFNDTDPDVITKQLFEIEGSKLLTDESTANLVYVRDVSQADEYAALDPLTARAVYLALAVKLAIPLAASGQIKADVRADAEMALARAKGASARDARAPLEDQGASSEFVLSRLR